MNKFVLALSALIVFSLPASVMAKCKNCDEKKNEQSADAGKDCCKGKHGKDGHKKGKKKGCCDDKAAGKEGEAAKAGSRDKKRVPASANKIKGAPAKLIYEGLPGEPDRLAKVVLGKEGDLICYKKEEAFHCSVRGEDEESGRFEGDPAKIVYEMLSSENEYEDGPGIAREASVKCTEKRGRTYICMIAE